MVKFTLSAPSRIPLRLWLAAVVATAIGQRRSPWRDGTTLWHSLKPEPVVLGTEYIPTAGPLLVVANHYNGPGIWVGLAGALLAKVVGDARPHVPIRGIGVAAYENFRLFGWLPVPDVVTRVLFARFYRAYSMVPMARATANPMARGLAVRHIIAALRAGETVLMFPEGGNVPNFAMQPLRAGVGDFLRLVIRANVPIIPAAVFEECGRFTIAFGPPLELSPTASTMALEEQAGRAIAALLPHRFRGVYA
jgi:hypothetical protein